MLPKAVRAAFSTTGSIPHRVLQFLVRGHYLGSPFWCPAALVGLITLPFHEDLAGLFLPLVAVPYFLAYALDVVLAKRRLRDLPAIYCLNLMLIPVNLAGSIASLRQVIAGKKVPFVRTPKIADRTVAPPGIVIAVWAGVAFLLMSAGFDAWLENYGDALLSGANGSALLVATLLFLGLKESVSDVRRSLLRRLPQSEDLPPPAEAVASEPQEPRARAA